MDNNDYLLKERVTQLTKKHGLTVAALCRIIDRSPGYLRDIWTRRNKIPESKAREIAKILDTTVEYLSGVTDDPRPKTPRADIDLIKFALFNGAEDVTDEEFEEVKRYAEYVLAKRGGK